MTNLKLDRSPPSESCDRGHFSPLDDVILVGILASLYQRRSAPFELWGWGNFSPLDNVVLVGVLADLYQRRIPCSESWSWCDFSSLDDIILVSVLANFYCRWISLFKQWSRGDLRNGNGVGPPLDARRTFVLRVDVLADHGGRSDFRRWCHLRSRFGFSYGDVGLGYVVSFQSSCTGKVTKGCIYAYRDGAGENQQCDCVLHLAS